MQHHPPPRVWDTLPHPTRTSHLAPQTNIFFQGHGVRPHHQVECEKPGVEKRAWQEQQQTACSEYRHDHSTCFWQRPQWNRPRLARVCVLRPQGREGGGHGGGAGGGHADVIHRYCCVQRHREASADQQGGLVCNVWRKDTRAVSHAGLIATNENVAAGAVGGCVIGGSLGSRL